MKVFIKNKFFSFGSSSVKNDRGEDVFIVKGRPFSATHVKKICDINGNKLFTVRNKWFNFIGHRAYLFDADKTKIACVKHPPFSGNKFIVEGYKDEILISGEFFSAYSTIVRNGQTIGSITREFSMVNDSFSLEADEADLPFAVALVIAIDNIVDKITKTR